MLTFEEWRHTYADIFETDDAARAAWTAASNKGYSAGVQDTRELLAAHSAGAQALDPRDVLADTGHPEADRLIGRLTSADPDFDDCTDAAVLIRQLVIEHRGPDGYVTWKEAAVAERQKRVEAERNAGMQGMPPAYDEISALLLDYAKACQESSSATRVSEARSAIMLAFRRALYAQPQPMTADKEVRYQKVCAAAYQLAGLVDAPLRFLDALSDASNGEPMADAIELLPVTQDECGAMMDAAETNCALLRRWARKQFAQLDRPSREIKRGGGYEHARAEGAF